MGTPGRRRRVELEDEYWRLLMSGVGTVEACREVGIGRKTGFRWRREMGGAPPVRHLELEAPGRYLSRVERHRIATLFRARTWSPRDCKATWTSPIDDFKRIESEQGFKGIPNL